MFLTNLVTANISLASKSLLAVTGHCPSWQGVVDLALRVGSTRFEHHARVVALSIIEAGLLAGAVNISLAAGVNHRRRN